jgi:hypothetical protein
MARPRRNTPWCSRSVVWAAIGVSVVTVLACCDCATIWSTQARSPDGQFVASAETVQNGGPGTAYIATTVTVRQSFKTEGPDVLVLSNLLPDLRLTWLTPTHLKISYTKPATVEFQAIRCFGTIEVSVEGPVENSDSRS